MIRALIGGAIGVACAILLIAGLGAWHGYTDGISTNGTPPGIDAAVQSSLFCVVYFWPVPSLCGALIGSISGFGSWLVRPRIPSYGQD